MSKYALLCGSAPESFRQKKLIEMHDFLISKAGGFVPERNIIIFSGGLHELLLESLLNSMFESASEEDDSEVLLYFCAMTKADLNAQVSDVYASNMEAIRLGKDEIRKDVIAYYSEELAKILCVKCHVAYESDSELVSEESIGYEKVEIEL